jgi:hypothetical protein
MQDNQHNIDKYTSDGRWNFTRAPGPKGTPQMQDIRQPALSQSQGAAYFTGAPTRAPRSELPQLNIH